MTAATEAKDRLICAVDVARLEDAALLAELLRGEVGAVKLGSEFFTANGPEGVRRIVAMGHRIFLDLKYHDIPNTAGAAVRAAAGLGCHMLTVHAAGGAAMLEAAVEAARSGGPSRLEVLAVTVLTSLADADLASVGQMGPIDRQVLRLATLARQAGVDGIVCSPHEIGALRAALGKDCRLVVPGVRPRWATLDDQKRVMTPGEAVAAGADQLVVGRPITRADDPVAACRRIIAELPA
jgi:orotidine-5'-phosphate decarboxylase